MGRLPGWHGCNGDVVIVIEDDRETLEQIFESVELGATYTCQDCMPYENNKPISICRSMRLPFEILWPRVRAYG
mgnify:CR=1 FL=1